MPRPRESTERACFTLRSDQLEGLRQISRETGAPVAELTRRAVDAYLVGRSARSGPGPLHPVPAPCEAGSLPPASRP